MDLSAILGSSSSSSATDAATKKDDLGRDEFMRMLITQLENQDPLNPQDATQFTAQLAQFSSLDQLFSMRTAIEKLSDVQGSTNALSVASLIGRDVTVESGAFSVPTTGSPPGLLVEASSSTEILGAEIRDAQGRLVSQIGARVLPSGVSQLDWADFGGAPPPGDYRIKVTPAGGASQPTTLVEAQVTGATFDSGVATLLLGNQPISLDHLRAVRQ